ncbi:hypothetical protein T03_13706 [Trichinella britovi]|uniref:Uncharacterized protein n=1 Tax=Trichinella britovi TaxID=45882 RepID=A0A0V0YX47_TRIBR|nr:hypothetical protein T03_13706 [Trichinella britovi]
MARKTEKGGKFKNVHVGRGDLEYGQKTENHGK